MALSKIDTAAIATDAIEAAQLKSDAITTGDLPASSVIKADIMAAQSPGTITLTNSSSYTTAFTVTYTPKVWGSKILILSNLNVWGDVDNDTQTSVQGQLKLQVSTDGGTTYTDKYETNSNILDRGGHSRFKTVFISYEMTLPASGTDVRIRWQGKRTASNRYMNFGGYAGSQVTVIEVQE